MRAVVKKTGAAKGRPSPAATGLVTSIELPDGMWARIAQKAYELWEQRGCQEGNDLRDWYDAEEIVMEEIHEARE
ncbi:MAG: DUF2934 domain-containing protein [Nitrospira sp.]|nr:DUF2934 domain-containing protein [Nitrospira sp.]